MPRALPGGAHALAQLAARRLPGGGVAGADADGTLAAWAAAAAAGGGVVEAETVELLDDADLVTLVTLLRVAQPPSQPPLRRVLLNLCAHTVTRSRLLKMLLALMRCGGSGAALAAVDTEMADVVGSGAAAAGGTGGGVPPAAAQGEAAAVESLLDILRDSEAAGASGGGVAAAVAAGSSAVAADWADAVADGSAAAGGAVSSGVQRRVLETLVHLARHSSLVARMLLHLRVPEHSSAAPLASAPAPAPVVVDLKGKGKAVAAPPPAAVPPPAAEDPDAGLPTPVEVLLGMLGQPLCQRSLSSLELTLQLLEVVLKGATAQLDSLHAQVVLREHTRVFGGPPGQRRATAAAAAAAAAGAPAAAGAGEPAATAPGAAAAVVVPAADAPPAAGGVLPAAPAAAPAEAAAPASSTPAAAAPAAAPAAAGEPAAASDAAAAPAAAGAAPPAAVSTAAAGAAPEPAPPSVPEPPVVDEAALAEAADGAATRAVLASLAPELVRQLPSLLGRTDLSDAAYVRVGNVLKALVDAAPSHAPLVLGELSLEVGRLAGATATLLADCAVRGADADASAMGLVACQGATVLRMLHALQAFRKDRPPGQGLPTAVAAAAAALAAHAAAPPAPAAAADAAAVASPAAPAAGPAPPAAAPSDGASGSSAAAAAPAPAQVAATSAVEAVAAAAAALAGVREAAAVAVSSVATQLEPLWRSLSSCITAIEDAMKTGLAQRGDVVTAARALPPGAAQVLPLVESFFVICSLQDWVPPIPPAQLPAGTLPPGAAPGTAAAPTGDFAATASQSALVSASSIVSAGSASALDDRHVTFLRFAERHKRLLNAFVRRTPALLETSLAPLLRVPRLLDFDNKRLYFRSKVRDDRAHYGSLRIAVRREHVFEDSFHQLRTRAPDEMRLKLSVQFQGEEGIDAGGVSREWYQVMAREMFNPNLALFVLVPEGGTTFQPNPNSIVQNDRGTNHLDFFRFVGRIVGKALYDGQLIDAYFTRSFYKHALGLALTYEDIEGVDPEYFKNLKWMLENDITDVLDLSFSAESDFFGRKEVVELVPGGKELRVTELNKLEYVNLIARHRMTTSIKTQIQAFLEGFWALVPRHLIAIFSDHELELLISGLPDIDVSDMKAHTEYSGYSAVSPVIRWFWEAVSAMEPQDLALLMQFVTGTSKVPLDGFKALQGISGPQRLQIHKAYGARERLPSAHTCFNQLDLPEYDSKENLTERLMVAIHEGSEGFGFG